MKEDILYISTLGAVKELTKKIVFKMVVPCQTSIEDIKEMANGIINLMEDYEKKLGI